MIIDTIPLTAPAAVAEMRFAHETVGKLTYDGFVSGVPAGPDLMRWCTPWTVSRGTDVVHAVEHANPCYPLGIDDLTGETGWTEQALDTRSWVLRR